MQGSGRRAACSAAAAINPHLLLLVPLLLQSKVLYGYKVDGKGGWDTQFRWQKDKASKQWMQWWLVAGTHPACPPPHAQQNQNLFGLPACQAVYRDHLLSACRPWPALACPAALQVLLDPYAKYVKGRSVFGQRDEFEQFKTLVSEPRSPEAAATANGSVAIFRSSRSSSEMGLLMQLDTVQCC